MQIEVKNYFDKVALNYEHRYTQLIDELLDPLVINKNSYILDLGCGKGIISEKLASLNENNEVIALDISSKMIEYAKANINHPRIKFINQDFYSFSSERQFDAIICFDAFPHFLDIDNFVNKANELLKKDGLLAIMHDCGRISLNSHHAAHAAHISRYLDTPKEEIKPFLKYFTPIEAYENNDEYKMILIKK